MTPSFTIRIYGIYIKEDNLLLCEEKHGDRSMLKFPGGGLEFGEGTLDCLKREMLEEFNLDIEVMKHFYTTDFFVQSAFHKDTQVMSIYYLIDVLNKEIPTDILHTQSNGEQMLKWVDLSTLDSSSLTFPIDQKVADILSAGLGES